MRKSEFYALSEYDQAFHILNNTVWILDLFKREVIFKVHSHMSIFETYPELKERDNRGLTKLEVGLDVLCTFGLARYHAIYSDEHYKTLVTHYSIPDGLFCFDVQKRVDYYNSFGVK